MAEKMKLGPKDTLPVEEGPVPTKYFSANTSKLTFPVKAGANTADFKLEK